MCTMHLQVPSYHPCLLPHVLMFQGPIAACRDSIAELHRQRMRFRYVCRDDHGHVTTDRTLPVNMTNTAIRHSISAKEWAAYIPVRSQYMAGPCQEPCMALARCLDGGTVS